MNDEDFLRTLFTEYLPDPPDSVLTVPAGLRRRARARAAVAVVLAVVLGIGLTATLVFGGRDDPPADDPPPDPFAAAFTQEWFWASVTRDDRTIVVPYQGNTCDRGELQLRAVESPDRVLVGLVYVTPPGPKPLPCNPAMMTMTKQVTLAEPLAGRTVIDAITNESRQIIKQSSFRLPRRLPATGTVHSSSAQPPDASDGRVWHYGAVWDDANLSLDVSTKDPFGGAASTPYRQFTIRGNVASFYVEPKAGSDPPLANSCGLHWIENGYYITLYYSSNSYIAVETMIQQVLDVANDMR